MSRRLDETDLHDLQRGAEAGFSHPTDVLRLVEEVRELRKAAGDFLEKNTPPRRVDTFIPFGDDKAAQEVLDRLKAGEIIRDPRRFDLSVKKLYEACGLPMPPLEPESPDSWKGQQKFTERLRRACQRANQESQRLGIEYIGVDQLLLGVLRADCVAVAALREIADTDAMIVRVKEVTPPVTPVSVIMGRLPYTVRAKAAIDGAVEGARSQGFEYVGTEHLLLALVSQDGSPLGPVFEQFGLTRQRILDRVMKILSLNEQESFPKSDPDPLLVLGDEGPTPIIRETN